MIFHKNSSNGLLYVMRTDGHMECHDKANTACYHYAMKMSE